MATAEGYRASQTCKPLSDIFKSTVVDVPATLAKFCANRYGRGDSSRALVHAADRAGRGRVSGVLFARMVAALLDPGPGADVVPATARSLNAALVEASGKGYIDVAVVLIAAGADVHFEENEPLRDAARNGHAQLVEMYLAAGADCTALNNSALRTSAAHGHAAVVSVLLAAGADRRAAYDDALNHASEGGHAEVVALLLAGGAYPLNSLWIAMSYERNAAGGAEVRRMLEAAVAQAH